MGATKQAMLDAADAVLRCAVCEAEVAWGHEDWCGYRRDLEWRGRPIALEDGAMHHELAAGTWSAAPALPQARDSVVRLATAAPMPGAGAGEVAVLVTIADDRVFHVGDLIVLRGGPPDQLVRVVGDVVRDAAGRWTMTGKLG